MLGLVFIALIGVSSAVAINYHHAYIHTYGITGLTAGAHGYYIESFDYMGHACYGGTLTCAIQSWQTLTSPVSKDASGLTKYPGIYLWK